MSEIRKVLLKFSIILALPLFLGCRGAQVANDPAQWKPAEETALQRAQRQIEQQAQTIEALKSGMQEKDAKLGSIQTAFDSEQTKRVELEKALTATAPDSVSADPPTPDVSGIRSELGGDVDANARPGGIALVLHGEGLFESGKASLSKKGMAAVAKAAAVVKKRFPQNDLIVEGHTDNEPIRKSAFASNWELSAARAVSVLHYLTDKGGLDSKHLSIAAYGDTRPIASNDSREGRGRNRRAVIFIKTSDI